MTDVDGLIGEHITPYIRQLAGEDGQYTDHPCEHYYAETLVEFAAALAELKAQLAAQEQTSDAVNAALWEAERQLAEARGATIEAKLAVANWGKYNGNMADEIVYQAEKMASAIRALPERTTP